MSNYQLLLALMDEYKTELKKRRDGDTITYWDGDVKREHKFRPANKNRLSRLRLEISRLMLQMERKMVSYSSLNDKEGWE